MQKGLVFDMDFTLIYPTIKFEEVFQEYFNIPFSNVSEKWLGAIYNDPKARGHKIIQRTFPDMSIDETKSKAEEFGLEWAKVHKIYPGCVEFLSSLRSNIDYKLGLLTNGPSDFQRAIINHFDITKLFDVIVVSGDDDVGVRKPNLEIFNIMARKMELAPDSLFMIGDIMDKDIKPAIEAGWGGIWVTPLSTEIKSKKPVKLQNLFDNSRNVQSEPLSIYWLDLINKIDNEIR